MKEEMKEVLEFANQNSSCWFATSVDDQPYVRGMWMWFADETGFYFHTAGSKRMCSQMKKNPKVALAFIRDASDAVKFSTLHVEGVVEEVHEKELFDRLFQDRHWLWDNIVNAGVDTEVVIYRVAHGKAYIWDMSKNVHESEIPRIEF